MTSLLAEDEDARAPVSNNGQSKTHKFAEGGRWRLLVLEDAGDLLTADARERTGYGLSRLLNLVDGLIGQGMKIMLLLTTNEELRSLHPAVARPGRCASAVEFTKLGNEEVDLWQAGHGLEGRLTGGRSLAELYGELEDFHGAKLKEAAGFQV